MAIRIALVGKKAVGKSAVALYLVQKHHFKKMRLDDALAKFLRDLYKYRKAQRITWEQRVRWYDTIYKLDKDVQVDHLLRRLAITTRNVVVDDVRYENELMKLRDEAGFTIVRVSAPESRRIHISGYRDAAPGALKMQEYFGRDIAKYPVDHSIMNDEREKTQRSLDRLIEHLSETHS